MRQRRYDVAENKQAEKGQKHHGQKPAGKKITDDFKGSEMS
jgi:hypothetical protein